MANVELDKIIRIYGEADKLLKEHGLLEQGWYFNLSKTKRFVGMCYHNEKRIEFSQYYLNQDWDEILDTLKHEIAHALCGPGHGHNYIWRAKALEVGAKPERCAPPNVVTSAQPNYIIKCPDCNRQWSRFRLRKSMFKAKCPDCKVQVKIFQVAR